MESAINIEQEKQQKQEQVIIEKQQVPLTESSLNDKIIDKNSEEIKFKVSLSTSIDKGEANKGNNKTRKYSRSELFKFAKSMKDSLTKEELIRFEEADWTQYNLDLLTDDNCEENCSSLKRLYNNKGDNINMPSPRNITNRLERQTSELGSDFRSLGYNNDNNYQQSNNSRVSGRTLLSRNNSSGFNRSNQSSTMNNRISRMTSSPSIRYNASTGAAINAASPRRSIHDQENFEGLSSQVKAKYAKLIETYSTNNNKQPLMRTPSHEGSFAERPTNLFGPLRRDDYTYRYKDNSRRNSSDGPQSLPYIPTVNNNNNNNKGSRWKVNNNNDKNRNHSIDQDDFASPIKRYTRNKSLENDDDDESCQTNNLHSSTVNEEDDFDITSLLSITVLSDIKTIRQDFQQQNHHHHHGRNSNQSNNERSHSSLNLSTNTSGPTGKLSSRRFATGNNNQQQQQNDYNRAPPALIRARTATDFTYNGRQQFNNNNNHFNDQHTVGAYHRAGHNNNNNSNSYYSDHYNRSSGPESLPIISGYNNNNNNHHNNNNSNLHIYGGREVARTSSQQNVSYQQQNESHTSISSKKSVDDNTAQIIKTFKEQVKARAREELDYQQQQQQQNQEKVDVKSASLNTGNKDDKKEESRKNETKIDPSLNQTNTRKKEGEDNKKDDILNNNNKLENNHEKDVINRKEQETNNCTDRDVNINVDLSKELSTKMPTNSLTKEELTSQAVDLSKCGKQDGNTKQVVVSNIPRLLSLHRQKLSNGSLISNNSTSQEDTKTNSTTGSHVGGNETTSTTSTKNVLTSTKSLATNTTTGSSSTKTKFVSQYKLLRGKSLADEVADSN